MDRDIEICERIPASANPSTEHSYASVDEELVGFDHHERIITKRLVSGSMYLDIVLIVGMAGIGKTALARKIYNSPSIASHFDVRAWCSVSQIYNLRKLALEILKQIVGDKCVNVDDAPDMLRKCLTGKRYLIVLDDIWESEAWNDMRLCFPDMEDGSRIMATTRNGDLYMCAKWYAHPYLIEFLNDEKSWELLQKKVFQGENCPLKLRKVGPLVAKSCKGLPSLIITIAEILSKRREASFWLEIAYDISSHSLEEESMKKIQSSYDSLPDHIKPCLLYMGLFPKGYEIPVSDLLKWWIAEDFVQNFDTLQLEEASQSCLHDLVGRNLVVVSKRRANREMKCCIVVDQVREFCLRKITEQKFMQRIVPYNSNEERLCMYIHDTMPSDFKERKSHGSLEFIAHPKLSISNSKNLFPLLDNFRLVRLLNLLDIYLDNSWAAAFQSLTQLRYLALFVKAFDLKWVSHLVHLQTLRVRSSYIMISPAILKMKNLRHVDINEFPITWEDEDDERVNFQESTDIVLDNLKTLGMCCMSMADMNPKFWEKFPNLEELRLHINEFVDVPSYSVSRLMSLEMFPSRLRVLSLGEIFLTDEIVSSIAKLQHLRTLKLSEIYFTGEKIWDLNDNKFVRLKVLKLHHVFMSKWICSEDTFRELEYLAIKSCPTLEEIPISFAYIYILQTIKVIDCSDSVGESAVKIQQKKEDLRGKDILQLHISRKAKDIWKAKDDGEESMKTIQSSYDSLPHHLKPCLLYTGLFPKGYPIPVSDLLKWWIAEDFVQSSDSSELEELSESCLHELVGRNLVVVSKRRANREMKCCKVVDQVRDFCLRKITEEKFMQHIVPYNSNEKRLSISNSKKLFPLLDNFRLVRVLHLLDIYLDNSWAAAFQSLTQLRYLAIFVKAFDLKWVSHLLHLQTLRVRSSYIMMSPAIWKMKTLRHVDLDEFPITWEDDGRVNFPDIVLDNLKTLGMCYMSVADMNRKFWKRFPNLEELRLQINEFVNGPSYSISILMSLGLFPSRLRVLSLSEIFLTDEIVLSIAVLQHLQTLKLSEIYFMGEKIWSLNENFVGLKVLKLYHVFMSKWICSDDTFPVLEYLAIKSCPTLEEIPLNFAFISSLQTIKVIDCSNSVGESAMKIKKERKECYGKDILQLHI